jgi:hypothetical protein
MKPETSALLKSFSPRLIVKAVQTFDRLTLLIISSCWAAAIIVMIFALYTVSLAIKAQKDVEEALVTEPALPTIKRTPIVSKEIQAMVDRLQHRYPDVAIRWENGNLLLAGVNGSSYHQWLTALGQVDTINPQYHWRIHELCVGTLCGGNTIMTITLAGEKVAFEAPQQDDKK